MAGAGVWRCRKCRFLNLDVATCQKCGAEIPPKLAKALEEQEEKVRFRWADDRTGRFEETFSAPAYQQPLAPSVPPTFSSGAALRPPTLPPNELPPWEQRLPRAAPPDGNPSPAAAAGPLVRPPRPGAYRRAMKSVLGLIVALLIVLVIESVMISNRHLDASGALKLNLGVAVAFYGLAGVWVTLRAYELDIRPRWLIGPARRAIPTGVVFGAVAVAVLAVANAAAIGHPVTDPFSALISEQPIGRLLLGVFVLTMLDPLVEELVFRGFLAEAFRSKGRAAALAASGFFFALAHLRFAQFRYFLLMGIAFAAIYWKRGLLGSMAAHGTFNGSLILLAVIISHGSPINYNVDGLVVRLPAAWHQVSASKADFGALGPGAAELSIAHFPLPSGPIDLGLVAAALQSGQAHLPGGVTFDPSTVQLVKTPVGTALRLRVTLYDHADDGALLVVGSRLIIFDFLGNGSGRARQDFDAALEGLRLAGLP